MKKAFTLLEVIIVVAIVTIIGMFSVPLYQQMQFRSDLNIAKSQVIQGLQNARQYAVAGKSDTTWSFFVPGGVIFPGSNYATAMANSDTANKAIILSMPQTVRFQGLSEVTYDRRGQPNVEGTITLTALNNEQQNISVTIVVNPGSISATAPASSSSSSAASSASSSITQTCPSFFTLGANNVITATTSTNLDLLNIAALRQSGGEYVPTYYCYSTDNGTNFSKMFQGNNGNCTGTGNAYGTQVNNNGGETTTTHLSSGNAFVVKVRNYLKHGGTLTINDIFDSKNQSSRFWYLRDGDSPGPDVQHTGLNALRSLLQARGYLDGAGYVNLGACELLLVTEMEVQNLATANYLDAIMKLSFH